MKEKKVKKKIARMSLLDDFLFGAVVAYPEVGERFVKILLRTIFGREFKHLSVTAQKVFYGADADLRGARLDVYIEPEEKGPDGRATVYDVEPERKRKDSDVRALPRRVRFYHGKIIARGLNSGMDYNGLKNVIVLMILPFDPFGRNRMVYTIKNMCKEEPDMKYEDGASTLFLYTKGKRGVPSHALRQLLRYMEQSTGENAVNDDLREVHRMVEIVKVDPETTISCVRLMEKLNRREKKGEARGIKKGEARGSEKKLITLVCKKMKLGQQLEKIASDLVEDISAIEPIYKEAGKFAPEYAPDSVLESLSKKK